MLPMPMDGCIDRREWTLQHRKAADITLTPPQADLEADCLDVNVKGPGEHDTKQGCMMWILFDMITDNFMFYV